MAYRSRYDDPGPNRQFLRVSFKRVKKGTVTQFKRDVRSLYRTFKSSIRQGTPLDTGLLVVSWKFRLVFDNDIKTVTVRLINDQEYANYTDSGSSIFRGYKYVRTPMETLTAAIKDLI